MNYLVGLFAAQTEQLQLGRGESVFLGPQKSAVRHLKPKREIKC